MSRLDVTRLSLAILLVVGLQAGGGQALAYRPRVSGWQPYHWPVKPFAGQHPIQVVFGDPRTVNPLQPFGRTKSNQQAVTPSATASTSPRRPARPSIRSSPARSSGRPGPDRVRTSDGRSFEYYHLDAAVHSGQYVVAQ